MTSGQRCRLQRAKNSKDGCLMKSFWKKTFDLRKWHLFYQHRVPLVETHRINYKLTLEVILKTWPRVKVMTWPEKVMLHISRSVSLSWTHLRCLNRSSITLSKCFVKNCWGPFMTRYDTRYIRRGHGCHFSVRLVDFTCKLMFKCLEWRSSKTGDFQFYSIDL